MKIVKKIWKTLGPGLVTGASDDDPSGIATYSEAGAKFGLNTLWLALVTIPLMIVIQENCARIGMVTSRGLAGTIKAHYPRYIFWPIVFLTVPAIIFNIAADIAAIGAVSNLLFPQISSIVFSVLFTALLLMTMILLSYQRMAVFLKYLCLVLLFYILIPLFTKPDFAQVIRHTFIPTIHLNKEYLQMLVAILGTTISPYLFFWQAIMAMEDMKHNRLLINKKLIHKMKIDINFGMIFSNIVMYFIILATASVLFKNGIHQINTVEQAAKALVPIAGKAAYWLFAIGIIGTGFLAIPVLSGTVSYVISETFNWESGFDKKYHEARAFYIIIAASLIIGLFINYLGINPIQTLIYSALLYGIITPLLIAIILHIANNKKIMGELTNSKTSNVIGIITLLLMTTSVLAYLYVTLF